MPGLLNQQTSAQAPNAGAPVPNATQATGPADQEESANVGPEEQEAYDAFVTNGMKIMYDEAAMPQLIESLRGDGNPVQGLANSLVMIVTRLEDSAAQGGQELSGDVMMHGGSELLEQMAELAGQAGIEYSEKDMESALYLAMDQYRETRQEQGKLPQEAFQADLQELAKAEQSGQIEEVFPGITEYAKNAPKPDEANPQPQRGG